MRRTNQEFKEEVLRRSGQYRRAQAKRRKTILGAALCVCLCVTAVLFVPGRGASNDSAADMVQMEIMESPAAAPEYGQDSPVEQDSVQSAAGITGAADAAVKIIFETGEIAMEPADAAVIMGYLSSEDWIPDAANCITDHTLQAGKVTYRYHSACGTVQDEAGRSLRLPEEDQQIVNDMLSRYLLGSD